MHQASVWEQGRQFSCEEKVTEHGPLNPDLCYVINAEAGVLGVVSAE